MKWKNSKKNMMLKLKQENLEKILKIKEIEIIVRLSLHPIPLPNYPRLQWLTVNSSYSYRKVSSNLIQVFLELPRSLYENDEILTPKTSG